MPKRAKRAASAPPHAAGVQLTACNLLKAECQYMYSMWPRCLCVKCFGTVAEGSTMVILLH